MTIEKPTLPSPRDEPERDPWLSHALRHAPDADAAPAPELSDAILRSARNAVKQRAPQAATSASMGSRAAQWWSWLARPPVAAGFATVMVGVLVGLMWIDKPIEEALPAKVGAPAAAPAPVPSQAPMPAREAAPPVPAESTNQTTNQSTNQEVGRADAADARARESKRAAPTPATPPKLAAKRERAVEQPSAQTEPTTAPAAPPAAASPSPFTDSAARSAPTAAAAPAANAAGKMTAADSARRSEELAERRGAAAESAAASASLAKSAPAPAPATALALRSQGAAATAAEAPFVIDAPERWQWQRRGVTEPGAMTAALRSWVEQLHRSVRWKQEPDAAAPAPGDVETVVLWRDGALYATIDIGAEGARLAMPGRTTLTAPLTPAVSARLKSSLLAATR